MNKLLLISVSLLTAVTLSVVGLSSIEKVSAAGNGCSLSIVDGPSNNGIKVNSAGTAVSATVRVTGASTCRKPVALAVWKLKNASGQPLSSQEFYGYSSSTYGPGTHTISTGIPKCSYWQADLLGQLRPKSINGDANYQYPQDALANYKIGGGPCTPPPPPPPPTTVDVCPNIAGNQATIPAGMIKDASGNCVTPNNPVDVCPNIDGMQTEVPAGYYRDASGNCVINPIPGDVCPNIDGKQTEIPAGMIKDANGNCVTPVDVCPNIAGMQAEVPAGMIKDANGNCVMAPVVVTPVTTQPTTLPRTGPVDAAAALGGTGLMASAAGSYIRSRRSLIKSLLFRK